MRALAVVPVRRPALLAVALVVLAVACGTEAAAPAVSNEQAVKVAGGLAAADASADASAMPSASFARAVAEPRPAATIPRTVADSMVGTMLIRRGDVLVRVDSIEPAMAAVRRLAAQLGGVVGNVSITAGEYDVRSAMLELRIPAARFDEAMGGLKPIGTLEQSNVSAEDVGEEYVDIRARVANARRLETRLVELLATRTGKLEDVLAVERELARVREEIERHEGRIRWLGAHVATSTISVTVSERAPVVGRTPGRSVIGEAFVQAWRNFVGVVAWLIASLGVLVPAGLVLWLVSRWWTGRRRRGSMEA